jgi:hypothetical protein
MLVFREGDTETNPGELPVSKSGFSTGNEFYHPAAWNQSGFDRLAKIQQSAQARHAVDFAESLEMPVWKPLAPAQTAAGDRIVITDSAGEVRDRFYRIALVP